MQAGLFPNCASMVFLASSTLFFLALFQAPPAPFLALFQASACVLGKHAISQLH